jgi:hypothetical protein
MKPKQIKIHFNTPIERWADENKCVIMDSIYENVFEFMESEEDDRVILQVQPIMKQERTLRRVIPQQGPVNVDFIISKDDIDLTLRKLLEHMVEVEEYEKCVEIVKLQNRDQSLPPKKRGRKKSIQK